MRRTATNRIPWSKLNPVVCYANELQCMPSYQFGPREISNYQFIYVVAGNGVCQIGGRRYEAATGDLFFYGPKVVHVFKAGENTPFLLYGLHFIWQGELTDAEKTYEIIEDRLVSAEAQQSNEMCIGDQGMDELKINDKLIVRGNKIIPELFLSIVKQYRNNSEKSALIGRGLLIQLLFQMHSHTRLEKVSLSPHARTVFEVRNKLKTQTSKLYDRSWLSEWTGYNADYLSRLFHEQFGVSPHEYHLTGKIDMAKVLLEQTNLLAGAIAEQLQFTSPHYFSRLFRQRTGMTPIAYRKQSRRM